MWVYMCMYASVYIDLICVYVYMCLRARMFLYLCTYAHVHIMLASVGLHVCILRLCRFLWTCVCMYMYIYL